MIREIECLPLPGTQQTETPTMAWDLVTRRQQSCVLSDSSVLITQASGDCSNRWKAKTSVGLIPLFIRCAINDGTDKPPTESGDLILTQRLH